MDIEQEYRERLKEIQRLKRCVAALHRTVQELLPDAERYRYLLSHCLQEGPSITLQADPRFECGRPAAEIQLTIDAEILARRRKCTD